MENLHPDITSEILSRVPIESLFQCKRVCKTWRSISRHVFKSRSDHEGCPPRSRLCILRMESRVRMRGHLKKPCGDFLEISDELLQPYIDEGYAYVGHATCKKVVQEELDIIKSLGNYVDDVLETLKMDYEDAKCLSRRARKEILTMQGIEDLLNSDDIEIPAECGWMLDYVMNPDKTELKQFLNYFEREELKYQHQMEKGQLGFQPIEENKLKDPEDKKERIRFLIKQAESAGIKISEIHLIKFDISTIISGSMDLIRLFEERFKCLSNHVCQKKSR